MEITTSKSCIDCGKYLTHWSRGDKRCSYHSHLSRRIPWVKRFWKKVKKTPYCWNWTASVHQKICGYGQLGINGKMQRVHQLSYKMHKGDIPKGLYVLHKCGNNLCVNPEHLYTGTQKQNVQDSINEGTFIRGETVASHKLTDDQVRQIRKLYVPARHTPFNGRNLCKKFGISQSAFSKIVRRETWKHVV